jgi:hypothetical protein
MRYVILPALALVNAVAITYLWMMVDAANERVKRLERELCV